MLDNNESTGAAKKKKGNSSNLSRQRFGGPYRHFQRRRTTVYHASSRSLLRTQPIFVRSVNRPRAAKRHRRALIQWLQRQKRELEARRPPHQSGDKKEPPAAEPGSSENDNGDPKRKNDHAEPEEEDEDEGKEGEESDYDDKNDQDENDDYENEAQALDNALFEVQRALDTSKYSVPERGVRGTMDPDTWAVRINGYTDMGDRSVPERRLWQCADDFLMSARRRRSSGVRVEPVPVVPAATLGLPDEGLLKSLNVYAMELLGGAVAAERYEGRFDETALLALGIVVEEHVSEMLGPTGHRVYSEYAQGSGNEAATTAVESDQEDNPLSNPEKVATWGDPLMYDGRRSKEAKRRDYLTCLKTEAEQAAADLANNDSGDESGNYQTEPESEPDDVDGIDVENSFNLSGQKYKPAATRRRPLGVADTDVPNRSAARFRRLVSRDIIENLF
ncbi:hypothetical protein D0Z00_002370 [Geotrichum galactomycetum]|uniref:Uncharacterized protein n=1 Tax=Geotrichum galactomycetum TaxID=27317 RepID=A0ACB6V4A6_9ASCO|nr:hypothetical protein D0Z00_002370 [Geotrichum candidum]